MLDKVSSLMINLEWPIVTERFKIESLRLHTDNCNTKLYKRIQECRLS